MAGGSSRGPFSFSLMLLLLLWDSHPCLWDFSIIIGTALFQFWKIIYSFLRHPKLCLGSGRHRFKTIGSQGGLSNRRLTEQLHGWCWHWTCWVPWCWEGSTRGEVVEQSGAEGLKGHRQAEGQGKRQSFTFRGLAAVLYAVRVSSPWQFEEGNPKSSEVSEMSRGTVKWRRYQKKEAGNYPSPCSVL